MKMKETDIVVISKLCQDNNFGIGIEQIKKSLRRRFANTKSWRLTVVGKKESLSKDISVIHPKFKKNGFKYLKKKHLKKQGNKNIDLNRINKKLSKINDNKSYGPHQLALYKPKQKIKTKGRELTLKRALKIANKGIPMCHNLIAYTDSNGDFIPNGTRSKGVTGVYRSSLITFNYTPPTFLGIGFPPGQLKYPQDTVEIGVDNSGQVLDFKCPILELELQSDELNGKLFAEVEVDNVKGHIPQNPDPDPNSGSTDYKLVGRGVNWKFWGDLTTTMLPGNPSISVSKDDPAEVGLPDIVSFSYASNNTLEANAQQVYRSNGVKQHLILLLLEKIHPGFTIPGTKVSWQIPLQQKTTVKKRTYVHHRKPKMVPFSL